MSLLRSVTSTVNTVCKRLKLEDRNGNAFVKSGRVVPCSVAAVKNGRRKMEDRHVVIHDMNIIFEEEGNQLVSEKLGSNAFSFLRFSCIINGVARPRLSANGRFMLIE